MYDLSALGEVLIDFTPAGISESGQKLFEQNPGGAPANVLATVNRFGMKTAFIGKVGNDMHGHFLKDVLDNAGIETKGLIVDESVFTTLAFVNLNEKGERNFSFSRKPGADIMLTDKEVNLNILKNSRIFHVGSLSLTDEPCRTATFYSLEKAKEYGCIISYDPNYRAPLWENKEKAITGMKSVLEYVDVMKLSDEETELISGKADYEEAAALLVKKGIPVVVVTLGAEGAYIGTKDGGRKVAGFQSNVVDTTGAGDSFWGGFLYRLLKSGKKPSEISLDEGVEFIKFANAVASLCVEKRGAIPGIPSIKQVLERLEY